MSQSVIRAGYGTSGRFSIGLEIVQVVWAAARWMLWFVVDVLSVLASCVASNWTLVYAVRR